MNRFSLSRTLLLSVALVIGSPFGYGQANTVPPALKIRVLVQSPAETKTDLQIICLFRSLPANSLHGSLTEIDERLHGLLTQIRTPALFNGDLGETILIVPPPNTIAARKLLIIGLGDSSDFTPARMYLVGKIALHEANRLGIAHPFFAPTILDGGVTTSATGDVAEQVGRGLLTALATETILRSKDAAGPSVVVDLTFLAGATHATDTQAGIDRAHLANPASK